MGLRRNARELALLFLCARDIQDDMTELAARGDEEARRAFADFCAHFCGDDEAEGGRKGRKGQKDDGFFRPFALWNWEIERCWRFPDRGEEDFCRWLAGNPAVRRYAGVLALGVCARARELDALIAARSFNWRLKRMAVVDRNIVRLAAWELEHGEDAPPQVVINEALEIAKRYAEADTVPFINGLLDGIRRDLAVPVPPPPAD